MKLIDLTGQTFGKLTVLYLCSEKRDNERMWHCKCECGNELDVRGKSLRIGETKSCGCIKSKNISEAQREDLTGKKFGKLTVMGFDGVAKNRQCKWLCRCECGQVVSIYASNLKRNHTKSCECHKGSIYENQVADELKSFKIPFVREATFEDLRGAKGGLLEVDFILLDKKREPIIAIEVNGRQHYTAKEGSWGYYQRTVSDPLKRKYFLRKNIPLFEIKITENISQTVKKISSYYQTVMSIPCQASIDEGVTTIPKGSTF